MFSVGVMVRILTRQVVFGRLCFVPKLLLPLVCFSGHHSVVPTVDMADGGGLGDDRVSSVLKFLPHDTIRKSRLQIHTAQGQDAKCF